MLEDCIERIGMNFSKSEKIMKYMVTAVNVLLLALTVLGVIKSVFVGFDIDEAYAVTQSYRMVMGDNMFSEMWESHQMSAFGLAFLMAPYLLITGGKTVGIVLYLRIAGNIIHLLLGWWFYKEASQRFGKTAGLLAMFAHINFLPKWIVLAEFEIMQYWAVCILFLSLLKWYSAVTKPYVEATGNVVKSSMFKWRKSDMWLVYAGAALFMAMMTYPTMILLYPVYALAILVLKGQPGKEKVRSLVIFTGTTFVIGVVFLVYLRTYMTPEDFLRYVSYIFMDESHAISLSRKISIYGGELGHFIRQMFLYSPVAIVATAVFAGVEWIVHKCGKGKQSDITEEKSVKDLLGKYIFVFMLFWLGIYVGKHIILSLVGDKNQFFLYFRYMVAVFVGVAGFALCIKKNCVYLWFGILPAIIGVVASAAVTNMSLEVAMARIYIGVMAGIFIVCTTIQEKYSKDWLIKLVGYAVMVSFVIGLVICKLLLVRVTGCVPVTMRMEMDWVKEGPAAGLLIDDELTAQYNENIPLIAEHIDEDDKLLYFGCENIYYMVSGADLATPSVQGTTVFNEMFTAYYEEHPDREPNVVIIDKGFSTNPYYNYAPQNQYMMDWIEESFESAKVIENEYIIILKK